jgi:hypothetical protein
MIRFAEQGLCPCPEFLPWLPPYMLDGRMKYLLLIFLLAFVPSANALNVIWNRSGATDSSLYGSAILPLGDQNNDGFNDWAVWAAGNRYVFHDLGTVPGVIEFFHGGTPLGSVPYFTIHGDLPTWGAAEAVDDLNGDGFVDWYVKTFNDQHSAYVISAYFGGPDADTLADWTLIIAGGDEFGPIGDFNGDGYADLYWYHQSGNYLDVMYGGSPMDTLPDWTIHMIPGSQWQPIPYGLGDLNHDGYSDFVSFSGNTNNTFIFLGASQPDTVPAYIWPQMPYWALGIVKDLNGDGFDDLLFNGAPEIDVHFGGPMMHSNRDAVLNFPCITPLSAFSAGDFNRDGYNDLILLTDYCAASDWGVLTLHLGHPTLNRDPVITVVGWTNPLNLIGIRTAASLGDVNGDGVDDIAIGSWDDLAYLGWRGRAVIIAGDTTLRVDADDPFILPPSSFSLSAYPNPFNATTTISFTLPKTGRVDLKVYDVTGRKTGGLLSAPTGVIAAGEHSIVFDGGDLCSGIYFVRLQSGTVSQTQKIVLLK